MAATIAVGLLACSGGDPVPVAEQDSEAPAAASPEDGSPPIVQQLELRPEVATASDSISLGLAVTDPDGDSVDVEIEWYRNGQLVDEQGRQFQDPFTFARGDRIYVVAYATDGTHDVEERTESLTIQNSVPSISEVRIDPPGATTTEMLTASINATDADEDELTYQYRWRVDDRLVVGADTQRLEPGRATRGQRVVAEVMASDGEESSDWHPSDPLSMGNAAPEITTQPVYQLESSGRYRYEVAAKDPDGDRPLRYELINGPSGMKVDVISGAVTWQVPQSADGTHPVELAVSDPHGARTVQRYSLEVRWESSPASPAATPDPDADSDDFDEPEAPEVEEPDADGPDEADSDFEDDFDDGEDF